MSVKNKYRFIINNPTIIFKYYKLKKELKENKTLGKFNFVYQIDSVGHFPHLEPFYKSLKMIVIKRYIFRLIMGNI